MLWVAVDKNNKIYLFDVEPIKDYETGEYSFPTNSKSVNYVEISVHTMIKLIGRSLSWEDEPIEIE